MNNSPVLDTTETEKLLGTSSLAEIRAVLKKNIEGALKLQALPIQVRSKAVVMDLTTAIVIFNLAQVRVEELQLLEARKADGSRAH